MRDRRALIPSTDDLVIISHISHHRPLCVQLHKRINKRTRTNSRPVASRRGRERGGNPERLRMRQCLCVIAACQCLYIFIMLRSPDFNNLTARRERYFFLLKKKLSNHVSSLSSGWMKHGYVTMAITIFGFCLHAVMRQSIPIIQALQPSVAYPGHAPHHGHLDIHCTFKCVNDTTTR